MPRPLLSIGQECDDDNFVVFSKYGGAVISELTGAVEHFGRLANGAYEMQMWLPPQKVVAEAQAQVFPRQGK